MHMADALLAPGVAGTMYACSAVVAGYSVKGIRCEEVEHGNKRDAGTGKER